MASAVGFQRIIIMMTPRCPIVKAEVTRAWHASSVSFRSDWAVGLGDKADRNWLYPFVGLRRSATPTPWINGTGEARGPASAGDSTAILNHGGEYNPQKNNRKLE